MTVHFTARCVGPSALWCGIYRKHANEAAVNDANGAHLLYRELTTLSPILFIAVLLIGAVSEAVPPCVPDPLHCPAGGAEDRHLRLSVKPQKR